MTGRVLFGNFLGVPRLRVAKPGYEVTDPALTNEQLAFDSAWPEILKVHKASYSYTTTTTANFVGGSTVSGVSLTYQRVDFPALPWPPIVWAWAKGVSGTQVTYSCLPAISFTDHAYIRGGSISTTAYIIFANPLAARDTREDDNGGSYNMLLGRHPTRGMGLFVPRRGADVLSCPDRDMRLTIEQPVLQVAEAGSVWADVIITIWPGNQPATYKIDKTIDLQGSYPDMPPVILIAASNALAAQENGASVTWITPSQIRIFTADAAVVLASQTIQYIIPALVPDYVHEPDLVSTPRVLMDADVCLAISKKNVDVRTASAENLLFRADRSALHISERKEAIYSGTGYAGSAPIDTITIGPPLATFGAYQFSGDLWFCAPGGMYIYGLRAIINGSNVMYIFDNGSPVNYMRASIVEYSAG